MVLLHAMSAAAGMIKVTCPSCGQGQSKMRSKSGRYLCKRCHHSFVAGTARSAARGKKRGVKTTLKR